MVHVCRPYAPLKLSGFDKTVAEISRLVVEAKKAAGISHDTPLDSLVGAGLTRL